MKYLCLGYMEESRWESMAPGDRAAFMDECLAYDAILRKDGHLVGGQALQSSRNAATLRFQQGKVSITDGPFAETKEQLGGVLVLEATDLNHAIHLMSNHPSLRFGGCWEVRPTEALGCQFLEENPL
ncbi:MAG: YciI family protein [Fimbriimonas sp.]